ELVEVGRALDAELGRPLRRQKWVEADYLHVQPGRPPRHLAADAPQADDTERFAGQLDDDKLAALPLALVHAGVGGGDMACQGHEHGDGVLGGADRVAAGRIHDDDAAARGGGDVDVVHADTGTDNGTQPAGVFQQVGGDARAAADDDAIGG